MSNYANDLRQLLSYVNKRTLMMHKFTATHQNKAKTANFYKISARKARK